MKKLLLIIVAQFIFLLSFGQGNQVTGRITDAITNAPLAGATVILVDFKLTVIADSTGIYTFNKIPSGHSVIEVSYIGYASIVEHLDITGNIHKDYSLIPSVVENETVTVTAVASATSIRKAPIIVSRINRNELLATPSTNLIDALTRQPGISQITTGPAISKPIIRGLGYNRLVVINDGIRQEGQQWGDEHGMEIDENSVNRVEIVKGPASLIYGSDAIAGVINIITTVPNPLNTVEGSILSSYQTNNKQRSLYGNIGGNHNGFNWNAWGDYKAAADYKNKYDGKVYNSKFNERNFGGHIGVNGSWGFSHFIASNFNQRVGLIEGERDANGNFIKPLPGGLQGLPSNTDFNSLDPQVPYQYIKHLKLISENTFKVGSGRISLNLGWQKNQRLEFGNADDPAEKELHFDLGTFSYNATYHFDDKKGWTTSVGINGMQQKNTNKGEEVLIPEYSLFDIGTFIYTQKTINKTTVSGGVRYDNRSLNAEEFIEGANIKFDHFKKQFSNISGSAGISYAASKTVTLKANIAKGFRAPSIPELASNGAHEGTNRYEYGSQYLKSETSLQGDLAFELNSPHILLTAGIFYNNISNFIFYRKLNALGGGDSLIMVDGENIPAFQYAQHNASLFGGELNLDIHPHPVDWLHLESMFSYVRARFSESIEGTRNVPFIPAARWINQLRAELFATGKRIKHLNVYAEIDHTFKQANAFTGYDTETPTESYTLLNAGVNSSVVNKSKTLFSIYLLANNITNVAYQNHLSRLKYASHNTSTNRQGVFNMGRNFTIKLNIPLAFE